MAYPSLSASPTLTNPDMILPCGDYDSTPSPTRTAYEPQDAAWGRSSGPSDMQFSLGPLHAPAMVPTTPIIYGNGTMLSDIGEVTEAESMPGGKLPGPAQRRMLKQRAQAQAAAAAASRSSPTLGYHTGIGKGAWISAHARKLSLESTSTVASEAPTADIFNDFDDGLSVDDSVFQGDDEESVADSYAEEIIAAETQRLSGRGNDSEKDDDQNSSAALSRRAEQILRNAKMRLNNMEGNLTRARSSIGITRSGSKASIHSSSPLSRSTPSPPNQQLGAGITRHHPLQTTSDSKSVSLGHSRVYSENSVALGLRATAFPVRSASAAARYMGKRGLELSPTEPSSSYSTGNIRERFLSSPVIQNSPPYGSQLEPLSESETTPGLDADRASVGNSMSEGRDSGNEHRGLRKSTSSMQMRDLREQMHELKGRLSALRDRARDDTMKRRSLQSLRTPSPFTAAEQWYTASKNNGAGNVDADAGVAAHASWNGGDANSSSSLDKPRGSNPLLDGTTEDKFHDTGYAASDVTSVYEDVSEGRRPSGELESHEQEDPIQENYDTAEDGQQEDLDDDIDKGYDDEMINHDELKDEDEYESDDSLYHDTFATHVSHEDREDAFDYEHFFLHSAMGTISQETHGRRGSVGSCSSQDSVKTARGPIAPSWISGGPLTNHHRSKSTDTVSSMATFATATEGRGSETGEDEEKDDLAEQYVVAPPLRTSTPVTAKRSVFGSPIKNGLNHDPQPTPEEESRPSSATHDRGELNGYTIHRPSVASFDSSNSSNSFESNGTCRSFPLVNKPKGYKSLTPDLRASQHTVSLFSDAATLTEGQGVGEEVQPSPVDMLSRDDKILVQRLVASLGKCVLGLQEAGKGSYESRVWRRRLDSARRNLEGEQGLPGIV